MVKIDYKNKKWLYTYLDTNEDVDEVVKYLKDNNEYIYVNNTHDSQSGWSGKSVVLQGIDLSGNGYCFSGEKLLYHVRNFMNFLELKNSEEYKQYIKLRKNLRKCMIILINSLLFKKKFC